jgi:molecular chaperone DnaK
MMSDPRPAEASGDRPVGIDLGTTYTAVAILDEDQRPALVPIPDQGDGPGTMPSVVLYEQDGRAVVGAEAERQALVRSERTVRWIKRSMGQDHTVTIDGRTYSPEEISSEILRKAVSEAAGELGRPVRSAVVTVPAWFEDRGRKATQRAGELAGLNVLKIVNEPVAAAVYYGVDKLVDGDTVMVYDLGGGTFDNSILRYSKGVFDHIMSLGDRNLGGYNWTESLVKHVAERLAETFGEDPRLDPRVAQQLQERCEVAKRDLARLPEVVIPCVYNGRGAEVAVTQAEFEEWTEPLLDVTLYWCEEAVNKSGLSWAEIKHLLLVGGSTRLRRVPEALTKLAGRTPIATGKEDTMVALGAAILSAEQVRVGRGARSVLRPVRVQERTHHALGMVTAGKPGEPPFVNARVIEAQTALPAERTRTDLTTLVDNQEHFDVAVLQGDDPDATRNLLNYTYRFTCPPGTPRGSAMAVTFAYNGNSQITVRARDLRSGRDLEGTAIEFTWPQGGGTQMVDIGFVLDCTGSMAGCISGVKQEIGNFCNELSRSALDYRLSLVEYRDLKCGEPTQTYDWTPDVERFRGWVAGLRADGGGDEPESGLDALVSAVELAPRSGAAHILVLITDATSHVPDQRGRDAAAVAGLIASRSARVFAIAPRFAAYERIVSETGGKLYDFNASFTPGRVNVELFREVLRDLGHAVIRTLLTVQA